MRHPVYYVAMSLHYNCFIVAHANQKSTNIIILYEHQIELFKDFFINTFR